MKKENLNLQAINYIMFKKLLFVLSLLTFSVSIGIAQTIENDFCGHRFEIEKNIQKNPNYLQWQNSLFQEAMQKFQEIESSKRKINSDTEYYEIKVVFHVLYNNTEQNINEAFIQDQMLVLNNAFRKKNGDTTRIRDIFKAIAADTRIQFVLADKDPQGNPTNGITRTPTSRTTFSINRIGQYSTDMKYTSRGGRNAWDPTKYLNIWVCNMRFPDQISMTLGFATPPTNAPNWDGFNATKDTTDPETGVVCHFSTIGRNHPQAINANVEAKTLVHEVGHFLGLRHTWGDGGGTAQGCNVDDGIMDTPNSRDRNYSCNNRPNTCNDAIDDKPDMTENYMDYALDNCSAMYTAQQAFMMRFVLNKLRTGLPFRKINFDTIPDFVKVILYPNPTFNNQNTNILIESPNNNEDFIASMIDMNGKQIFERNLLSNSKSNLPTEVLANGIYFILVREKESGKIISKQKLLIN